MSIYVLIDEFSLYECYSGATALSAYTSESDAIDALNAIAEEHGVKVSFYYTVINGEQCTRPCVRFSDSPNEFGECEDHDVRIYQTQLI